MKLTEKQLAEARRIFASIGGRAKSAKKAKSSRKNGKLGGRPRKS